MFGACGDAGDPFVPDYTTERLRVGTSFTDGLCRGELDMWEAHLDEVERTLGVARASAWLFVYGDDERTQVAADCGSGLAELNGCWRDPVARGVRFAAPHELVHAWLATTQPRALPVLSEGIAHRMSGLVMSILEEPFAAEEAGPLSLEELVLDVPGGKYDEAGHLVAWLLDTRGAETFMALYRRTRYGMSEDELSAAFVEVLGQTPAEVLGDYASTAREHYPGMGGAACGRGPRAAWRDGAATWEVATACADGPLFGLEDRLQLQRVTIEVAEAGWYVLDTGGRDATMTACLGAPADAAELRDSPRWWAVKGDWEDGVPLIDLYRPVAVQRHDDWAEHELELTAGVYDVWMRRRAGEPEGVVGLFARDP